MKLSDKIASGKYEVYYTNKRALWPSGAHLRMTVYKSIGKLTTL